ncbi:gliding motility-associated C-terminal domain-containing protein [Flavobacterium humidisoli]|uniref:Gliding motility-associated C-terminal domain-containing protein n=1 Tax=Flavobacterium humidisoli TaxID=2937442 RepID=A0ABY4M0I2_9FLAO|nr:gliding motility-associated C-terminal domain-containing protein [Flavobacterium humidisoli]UPZ17969.1 gliding motility-associated C-terminal domain-containing protein [Flavobacterium humidisoli]
MSSFFKFILSFFFFLLATFTSVFAQCSTASFTVAKTNGTCFANGSISVNVPASVNCNGWRAELRKVSDGSVVVQSVPVLGGVVVFNSLQPDNYNVALTNGLSTILYSGNPVIITSSYVPVVITSSSKAPTCSKLGTLYSPDGTLTVNVANGIGPFRYDVISVLGSQSFLSQGATAADRTHTFLGMDAGETVSISVTDLGNGQSGCSYTVKQSQVIASNNATPLSFGGRSFNFIRDCSSGKCDEPILYVNLSNYTPAGLTTLKQPGNSTITIGGVSYDLSYDANNRVFYDSSISGRPKLVNGLDVKVSFNDGCNVITKTSKVAMNNNYLITGFATVPDLSSCSVRYQIQVLGYEDLDGNRNIYYCNKNSLVFERRISTNPDVWHVLDNTEVLPGGVYPADNPLNVTGELTSALANSNTLWTVASPGLYRITASDNCHTVTRLMSVTSTGNAFDGFSVSEGTSVIEGTSSIRIQQPNAAFQNPVSIKISRLDGQSSVVVNASQPGSLSASYNVDFPIVRSYNSVNGNITVISDLPIGDYIVEISDGCTVVNGLSKTFNIKLSKPTHYNPTFTVIDGCINSSNIDYNLNPSNIGFPVNVALYKKNASGGLGALVANSASSGTVNFFKGSFSNLSSGDYLIRFTNVQAIGGVQSYSACLKKSGPFEYLYPVTVKPYVAPSAKVSTVLCDSTGGIAIVTLSSGTVVYPLTISLYSNSNPATPLQGPFNILSPQNSYTFSNIPLGSYFARISDSCISFDQSFELTNVASLPSANASRSIVCPNSPISLNFIDGSASLYDVTWKDDKGNIVGSGSPISVSPAVTTVYTADFSLKPSLGCGNKDHYSSSVTVEVIPDPILTLKVSNIDLCDPNSNKSITIFNTQDSRFLYEILSSSGSSFIPRLIANGNGGDLVIDLPSSLILNKGDLFRVKVIGGDESCSGLLLNNVNVLKGTFPAGVVCPTFVSNKVSCFAEIPNKNKITKQEFLALGNGDGRLDFTTCGIIEISASNSTLPNSCSGSVTRTYTLNEYDDTNGNGIRDSNENVILNTVNCYENFQVEDKIAPVFVEALPTDVVVDCDAVPTAVTLTATDNCGTALVTYNEVKTVGRCTGFYILYRTWTATDECGNASTHTQIIYVGDNTKPVFVESLPSNVTVECSAIPIAVTLTATDNCGTATVAYNEVKTAGSCSGSYTLDRTWTATDECGNSTAHTQTITVQDTTKPVFVEALPADVTVECSAIPTAATLTATDNCGIATVAYNEVKRASSCPGRYVLERTWVATDQCGQFRDYTQTITVVDFTKPVFVESLPADVTVECTIPTAATLTATDNCGTATVGYNEVKTAGSCAGNYTLDRTWTATDECGNSTAHTQTITVQDTTKPVFVEALPADVTVECSAIPTAATLTATDNCGIATVAYNEVKRASSCPGRYVLERTWVATDQCGQFRDYTQTITVVDFTKPVFVESLPADVTVECTIPTAATLTATDNCGTATVGYNEVKTAGSCAGNYTLDRTWTATDECGNSTAHTQTITVQDTTKPVFVEALPSDVTVECSAIPTAATLTATDNCGIATVAYNEVKRAISCPGRYVLERTWVATDQCGQFRDYTQTITVEDFTKPVFVESLPADVTVECSAIPTAATLTATDNCGTATVGYNEVKTAGSCAGNYTLDRTWTATDECGNSTAHTQTITVQDTTKPVFVEALPSDVTVECSAIPTAATLTATDNCGTATVGYNEVKTAGSCAGNYTLDRTWTATDECGNSTAHTQTITVQDTTKPVFVESLPADATVECSAIPTAATLTATDNCGTATVGYNEVKTAGSCAGNYTLDRTWTATDECGNSTAHTQTITVQDTTKPVFVEALPSDATVECSAIPTAATLTATDNCGTATVGYNEVKTAGSCAGNYTLDRTWTATDECGNSTAHTQTITVQDTTKPVFVEALPSDATVECSAIPTAATLTATDNCGTATVGYNEVKTAGSCAGNYTLDRTWTATDECGNSTAHTQTITVQDTTKPVFVEALPSDVTVECSAIPTAATLTATDNCGTATVGYNEVKTAGSCAGNYTLDRTWTATDECGNSTAHTQTITVQDTTKPVFVESLPADVTVECSAIPTAATLTATDNCGTATVGYNEVKTAGSCAGNYTLDRTWTATDECGNSTAHTQTITVQDTTKPVFVEALPSDLTVECSAIPAAATLTATDSCGTATVAYNEVKTAGSCSGSYTLDRTWTATDECGNSTAHTQTITVQDTTKPVFVEALPSDATVECSAIPTAATLTATDNCGTATVGYNEVKTAGSCAGNYTLDRTWTATDECGNSTSHTQTITVQDTAKPVFVEALPSDVTVECSAIPTAATLTATDNCGTATVGYNEVKTAGSCAGNYTLDRTWTATDECGNSTAHTQTITVQDTAKPVILQTVGELDVVLKCADKEGLTKALKLIPTAIDNCSTNLNLHLLEDNTININGNCDYIRERKWNVSDDCGNVSSDFIQTITIENESLPVAPIILATDDYVDSIDGINGVRDVINVLSNDFIDSVSANAENVKIKVIIPDETGSISLNNDGSVDLNAGTPVGKYTLVYEICASESTSVCDQAILTVNVIAPKIVATNDNFVNDPIDSSKGAVLDVLSNDIINNGLANSSQLNLSIVYSDGLKGLVVDSSGKIIIPIGSPVGNYNLKYTICDVVNINNCSTATVSIVIKDPCDFSDISSSCDILVHNAFSPNSDGINDSFIIDRIEDYPDNKVEIYNRWGVLVFEISGYNNSSKVFVGLSQGRVTINRNELLPNGTYYYVIKYKNNSSSGTVKEKSGFLYISR